MCYSATNPLTPLLMHSPIHMLDEKDLQAIRGVVKDEVRGEVRAIVKGELSTGVREIVKQEIQLEARMIEKNVIAAVGEMLEQNVFPQFETINRRLDEHDRILGWRQ